MGQKDDNLINYLKYVYELEKNIYEQNIVIDRMQDSVQMLNHQLRLQPSIYQESKVQVKARIAYLSIAVVILIVVLAFKRMLIAFDTLDPVIGGMLQIVIVLSSIMSIVGIILVAQKVMDTKEYNKRVREENQNNILEIETIQQQAKQKKQVILHNYHLFKTQLDENRKVLDEFYEKNLLHPKYRNLPAVASIYEFLQTQLCFDLVGPNGAYYLYEQKVAWGIIIEKLDDISNDLKEIKCNQRMLYNALEETKTITNNLLKQELINGNLLYDIKSSNRVMQYNQIQMKNRMDAINFLEEQKNLLGK